MHAYELSEPPTGTTSLSATLREALRSLRPLLLVGVLLLGAYFRLLHVDWDEGQHQHPDERFLTIVESNIRTPWYRPEADRRPPPPGCREWGGYFDSQCSPLNPFNRGHGGRGGFVYGTLPIILTRAVAEGLNAACEDPARPESRPALLPRLVARALFGLPAKGCVGERFTGYGGVYLVGRILAALADLGAVLLLFFTGRRLYGPWVGLLASAFSALAVLQIQQAHFFTVDAFANFFVVLSFYFAVRLAQEGRLRDAALSGLALGLAVACKINVAPLALIISLAVGLWGWRAARPTTTRVLLLLVVAGLFAFLGFRIGQPYAFAGPDFSLIQMTGPDWDWVRPYLPDWWDTLFNRLPGPVRTLLLPDPRFVGNLVYIRELISGEIDVPYGHQWTARTPLLFPWKNIVFWGLGLPLGLTAWIAWGWAGWQLWRGLRRKGLAPRTEVAAPWVAHLLPWTWVTLYFGYMGVQWVKSMRYMLPIYPFLALLAAWLLVGRRGTAGSPVSKLRIPTLRLPNLRPLFLALVLLGTFLWAFAFTRIYARPLSRNTASRWIYRNIPTAITLLYAPEGGDAQDLAALQLEVPVVPNGYTFNDASVVQTVRLKLPTGGRVRAVRYNRLSDPMADPEPERVRAVLALDPEGKQPLATVEAELHLEPQEAQGTPFSYGRPYTLTFPSPVTLEPGREYWLLTRVPQGAPVLMRSLVIANERWDDGLPLPVDGKDAFGALYHNLSSEPDGKMGPYDEDTPDKLQKFLTWLDEADVILLTSNRVYASVVRLPTRYPLTIAYYRALFAGELGFEPVAEFTSYPNLGPIQFPDQEDPFLLKEPRYREQAGTISVRLPPAEEVFSVYDHQRIIVFRKTPAYSRERVAEILGRVDLDRVIWMSPKDATRAPNALLMDEATWRERRHWGTWAALFDPAGLLNRFPFLGLIVWLVLIQLLGWLAWPLLYVALPGLPDRGYPLARTLGLLLFAYLAWIGASLRLWPYTRPVLWLLLLLLVVVGGGVGWWQRRALRAFFRAHRRTLLASEAVYGLIFLIFLLIRYGNPDLWHPVMGGEKPMDFAYLNAVLKSERFPPYDPWFAQGYLNYYYFGFVLVGTPIKLLGILPEIAYNLAIPTLAALTGAGAFSAAANLVTLASRRAPATEPSDAVPTAPTPITALIAGLLAALFVVLLGNLGELKLWLEKLAEVGQVTFPSTIPGFPEAVSVVRGLWRALIGGVPVPLRPEDPYWAPTRLIPHPQSEAAPITEFPFFTFLYGDLHAHMISLPLMLLALGLAMGEVWRRRRGSRGPALLALLLAALTVGALRATNTWDYPTFLGLMGAAMLLGYLASPRPADSPVHPSWALLEQVGGRFLLFAFLTWLFFQPYVAHYATAYASIQLWKGSKTPLWAYLAIHGLFLFPIVTWLVVQVRRGGETRRPRSAGGVQEPGSKVADLSGEGAPARWEQEAAGGQGGLVAWLILLGVLALGMAVLGYRAALVVLPVGGLAAWVLLAAEERWAATGEAIAPTLPGRFLALLVGLALAITLGVEVIVLKGDISRMNTVFKFYLQVWVLLGVSAAVTLVWVAPRTFRWSHTARRWWWGLLLALLFAAALYPLLATRARVRDRYVREIGPTLDGMTFLSRATTFQEGQEYALKWDLEALRWMRAHIAGSPVVAEATAGMPYRSLRARVATYTGLPIILGYPWHQQQQRSAVPHIDAIIRKREQDVATLYNTLDVAEALEVLDRYDVDYIYVGHLERAYYAPAGLEKFRRMTQMGLLQQVYANPDVVLYRVVR